MGGQNSTLNCCSGYDDNEIKNQIEAGKILRPVASETFRNIHYKSEEIAKIIRLQLAVKKWRARCQAAQNYDILSPDKLHQVEKE